MASTPAAIAAAIGSREGSGPMSGTGAGPLTGLLAVDTADFACAAASFAAEARSPLVSARFAAADAFFGGAFFAAAFLAAFLAGAFFAGVFLAALAGAFFAADLAGVFLAGGAGGSAAGGTGSGLGADDAGCSAGAEASGVSSDRSCWSAIWLLLCDRVIYPGSGSHHARPQTALAGHCQCGRQRQRDAHHRQFKQRP